MDFRGGDVVYKGWLKKGTNFDDSKKKSFLRASSRWKKRFCILVKLGEDGRDIAYFTCYEKEPSSDADKPKEFLRLWPHYRLYKKHDPSGKNHIFEIVTPDETFRLMADKVTVLDLWVIYMQMQTKMLPSFQGKVFEVLPDDCDASRRIGARGSTCYLHLSRWGVTLALMRSRSVLAQWPLKCIREFESSETGIFSFDAGRNSPMGEALYKFITNPGDDGRMYDILDEYTTEMIRARQASTANTPVGYQEVSDEEIKEDYQELRLATFGLLPVKPKQGIPNQPSVASPPSASMAVPVPRPRDEYNHLQRGPVEVKKNPQQAPPVLPPRALLQLDGSQGPVVPTAKQPPPVPLETHPSLTHKNKRSTLEEEILNTDLSSPDSMSYTEMSPGNSLSRISDETKLEKMGKTLMNTIGSSLPLPMFQKGGDDHFDYANMSKTPYRSDLCSSYENAPLITPSSIELPGGWGNVGYLGSPVSPPACPPKARRSRLSSNSSSSYTSPPITHTYFETSLQQKPSPEIEVVQRRKKSDDFIVRMGQTPSSHSLRSTLYARVNRNLRRSVSAGNLIEIGRDSDVFRMSDISAISIGSFRMSGVSFQSSSPLIGSLDLARSVVSSRPPSWLKTRQLPSLPRDSVLPPEPNTYGKSPGIYNSISEPGTSSGSEPSVGKKKSYKDIDDMRKNLSKRVTDYEDIEEDEIGEIYGRGESDLRRSLNQAIHDETHVVNGTSVVNEMKHESLRRTHSTGDILDLDNVYGEGDDVTDKAAEAETEPKSISAILKKFQSDPDLVEAPKFPGSPKRKEPQIKAIKPASHTEAGNISSRKNTFTWTLKRLKYFSSESKKKRAQEESKNVEKSEMMVNNTGTEIASSNHALSGSSHVTKSKPNKTRPHSKDKERNSTGKEFKSPTNVKGIVASSKTKTFSKRSSPSSTTSLDTISVNSRTSLLHQESVTSMGSSLVYAPAETDEKRSNSDSAGIHSDISPPRRLSESLHAKKNSDSPSAERRNTTPDVKGSASGNIQFEAQI